ncbi:MAG: hypothetical protein QNJ97_00675 [Myxococcota bacterium]|nr:hypothetical protein [Myxococcota bacterium]
MAIYKKTLTKGILLAVVFWAILIAMFMPLFDGQNAFDASDELFNSISKGSTHYIPKIAEAATEYNGKQVSLSIALEDSSVIANAKKILETVGMDVTVSGSAIELNGDLGILLKAVLTDSDDMFFNRGDALKSRYNIEEKTAMFAWWHILKGAEKSFKSKGGRENFAMAKLVADVTARGVEVGYNFYKIEPESVSSKAFILIFALVFYVIYTLWWGYAIYFLAEGLGLQLAGGKKKEV